MSEVEEVLEDINARLGVMIKAQIDRYFKSGRYMPIERWIQTDRESDFSKRMVDLIIVKEFIHNVVLGGENEGSNAVPAPGGRPVPDA